MPQVFLLDGSSRQRQHGALPNHWAMRQSRVHIEEEAMQKFGPWHQWLRSPDVKSCMSYRAFPHAALCWVQIYPRINRNRDSWSLSLVFVYSMTT